MPPAVCAPEQAAKFGNCSLFRRCHHPLRTQSSFSAPDIFTLAEKAFYDRSVDADAAVPSGRINNLCLLRSSHGVLFNKAGKAAVFGERLNQDRVLLVSFAVLLVSASLERLALGSAGMRLTSLNFRRLYRPDECEPRIGGIGAGCLKYATRTCEFRSPV
jgi:hypothetical protein